MELATGSSGCPRFCVDGAGTALKKKLFAKDRRVPFNFCSNHALLPLSLFPLPVHGKCYLRRLDAGSCVYRFLTVAGCLGLNCVLSDYIKMLAFVCLTHQRRAGPSGPAITWPHTRSRVAKQSLSKQDTSISVAPGLHRLPACSNAWGSGVCSVSLLVFIFISL